MKAMKVSLSLSLSFLLLSCVSTSSVPLLDKYQNSINSSDFIVDKFKTIKVMFIGETHATVGPILFLAENIKAFQKAGVRYLFLEGLLPKRSNAEDFRFISFYPWTRQAGWKYEKLLLADKINDLNKDLIETDRIQVIYPEREIPESLDRLNVSEQELLIKRDMVASKKIIDVLNRTSQDEKAIVFYGADHGAKKERPFTVDGNKDSSWKPIGSYLSDYYGDKFYSIAQLELINYIFYRDLNISEWNKISKIDTIMEPHKLKGDVVFNEYSRRKDISLYDAYHITKEPIYGIFYQYIATDDNLRYMFKMLNDYESNLEKVINDNSDYRFGMKGQFLIYLYYMKMYFGSKFNYSLWSPDSNLKSALSQLGEYAFENLSSPSLMISNTVEDIEKIRKYHELMHGSGIESMIKQIDSNFEDWTIRNMNIASSIMKNDLWPFYWKGIAEMKKNNYKSALEDFERIIKDEISLCLEVLPDVYDKASICAQENGDEPKAKEYRDSAVKMRSNFRFGNMKFGDVM